MLANRTLRLGLILSACTLLAFTAGRSTAQPEGGEPRLYELRIYTTLPGRLEALHARFRNHTAKLFEKHGMKNHMYWVPTDEKTRDNTLIYVVSHKNQAAADKSWSEFIADPEWKKVQAASEQDGKIVAKVEKHYMTLVDYSPVKQ
jgi:hypothetical protein